MVDTIKPNALILCLFFISLMFLITSYCSNDSVSINDSAYVFNATATLQLLQQAKEHETQLETIYQVTAIVLHWKRLSRVRLLVEHYVSSKLVQEIIVWNNNPQSNLTLNDLQINSHLSIPIRIINSYVNLKDEAKYRACIEAHTLACFYADDDWNVSGYMRSLIATFRSDPNVLHSVTNIITYYNNMLWTFMDSRIDLHTGFSWIGCGSVFLREHARRFLQLLAVHLQTNQELFSFSDVFFSIWLNDIPSQMVVNLHELPANANETDLSFSSTSGFYRLQAASAVLAIRKLESSLRLNQHTVNVSFPRQQHRRFPYYIRSPSSTDDFVIYSNVLPIEIENIPFDITVDAYRATYRNVPGGSNYTYFASHSVLYAVDNSETTCWQTNRSLRKGDFFAIDFLRIQANTVFSITIGHTQQMQNSLLMQLSFDGVIWILYQSSQGINVHVPRISSGKYHRLIINSSQFPTPLRSFRYFAFKSIHPFDEAFQVCDIRLLPMSSINNA